MDIERAPYGRQRLTDRQPVGQHGAPPIPAYQGQTYYDRPAVKASHYGQLVAGYFFVGGMAGAAQLLACTADLAGPDGNRSVVRNGRYLALAGSVVGPVLLIADLHTPQRWYNMLRIFRRTSAMSLGAWTLVAFGALSTATAATQLFADRTRRPAFRRLARWFGVPAAVAGGVMSTYTGTLLSSTATPLWAAGERHLPALFGASAVSTATAALSLAEHLRGQPSGSSGLARLAVIADGAELLIATSAERRWRQLGVAAPLQRGPKAWAYRLGFRGLGLLTPLTLHGMNALTRRRSRTLSLAAAVATLAGGYLLRSVLVSAGNESARRPRDYFQSTQPHDGVKPR